MLDLLGGEVSAQALALGLEVLGEQHGMVSEHQPAMDAARGSDEPWEVRACGRLFFEVRHVPTRAKLETIHSSSAESVALPPEIVPPVARAASYSMTIEFRPDPK
jgi:hypothetical protein